MSLLRTAVLTAAALAALSASLLASPAQAAPARAALPGGPSALAAVSLPLGRTSPSAPVSLASSLPPRNPAQMTQLVRDLYDSNSPRFGQFLSSAQYAAQFGPAQADYDAVIAFAKASGLTVTRTYPERTLIDVAGPASAVQAAFGVTLRQYESPNGDVFHAPDAAPSVPASLAGRVSAVSGLDTGVKRFTQLQQKQAVSLASPASAGSGLGGGLIPTDIRTAYGLNTGNLTGAGQTLAVFELDTYTPKDVLRYERNFGLPVVPLENVLVDTNDTQNFPFYPGGGTAEVILDIDMQIAVAPKAAKVLVYIAPNTNQGVVDCYQRIASDNRAKSISTSWATFEDREGGSPNLGEFSAFQQMAIQGQSIFASAGDTGGFDRGVGQISAQDPPAQPYMCSVGGTTLTVQNAGTNENYKSETTWNDGPNSAGGGGVSVFWSMPYYQRNAATATASYYPKSGVSGSMRNVPDVSLNADPNTGYLLYVTDPSAGAGYYIYGGTSASAPLWAGITALVNQGRANAGKGPLGFANPALYSFGPGGANAARYGADFHDIADGSNNNPFVAVPGFDNATGLGTINGTGLLADLIAY